jgi:K+-sensing histidine kinase KdpD
MPTIAEHLPLPEREGSPMRAERLLRNMNKVFSHDLPNEMVALQSLLQFLALEETDRLGADGREYLRRSQNAARRASDMVRFLKEMARVNAFMCRTETVALEPLARELQSEVQRLYPARDFIFAWQWDVPALVGDARVFLQALLELFAGLLSPQGLRCQVQAGARQLKDAVELTFQLAETPAVPIPPAAESRGLDDKMEIILAREWLALCGANVAVTRNGAGGTRFTIAVPNPNAAKP